MSQISDPLLASASASEEQKLRILTAEHNGQTSCCPFCGSRLIVSIQQTWLLINGKSRFGPCSKSFHCPDLKCQFAFEVTC